MKLQTHTHTHTQRFRVRFWAPRCADALLSGPTTEERLIALCAMRCAADKSKIYLESDSAQRSFLQTPRPFFWLKSLHPWECLICIQYRIEVWDSHRKSTIPPQQQLCRIESLSAQRFASQLVRIIASQFAAERRGVNKSN